LSVRMVDIAEDLGVSLMTVSKALRNKNDIGQQTRERVQKRARELGYQPNWVARGLATRRTYLVGLVVPDLLHSFFAEVANGVSQALEPAGYQAVILNSGENGEREEHQVYALLARRVDGLIIASAQRSGRARLFRVLRDQKIPLVLIDRLPAGIRANYVGGKNEEIGELATGHLVEQGCQRIAHLCGPAISTGIGRLSGYRRKLAACGLAAPPEYVVEAQRSDGTGFVAMRELLRLRPRPDGVFCYNDPIAAGAIKAVLEAGLSVPNDIAIIGAGNGHYSDLLRVPLSSIDLNSVLIGQTAAHLLRKCIEAKGPTRPTCTFIPHRLIVRESSLRLAKACST
jgi:LacI family transcriptional regulator